MNRRNGRRSSRSVWRTGDGSLLSTLLYLSGGRPVFSADNYIQDPVSGKVRAFVDWNDSTHLLVQATAASQAALPTDHPSFAGRPCVSMTGAFFYVSNRTTTYWGTLQAEAGYVYDVTSFVSTAAQLYWETGNGAENPASISRYTYGTAASYAGMRPRASPTTFTEANRGGVAVDVGILARTRRTSTTLHLRATGGGTETSSALAASPDGTVSARPLTIGRSGLSNSHRFRWLAWLPELTADELSTVDRFFKVDCGISP